jgi:hypothetical protein
MLLPSSAPGVSIETLAVSNRMEAAFQILTSDIAASDPPSDRPRA